MNTKLDAELITKYKYRRLSVAGFVVVVDVVFLQIMYKLVDVFGSVEFHSSFFSPFLFSLNVEMREYFCSESIMGSL